uniref:Putative product n=1 Tax=Xenopsylla cheopis TaxID=163159 RepID=A0A6M2DFI0_XENCH
MCGIDLPAIHCKVSDVLECLLDEPLSIEIEQNRRHAASLTHSPSDFSSFGISLVQSHFDHSGLRISSVSAFGPSSRPLSSLVIPLFLVFDDIIASVLQIICLGFARFAPEFVILLPCVHDFIRVLVFPSFFHFLQHFLCHP